MIHSVDFISRMKAEALLDRGDLAVISITEPEAGPAALLCPESAILRLVFHDVDPGHETTSSWTLFNEQHAQQVLKFVRALHGEARQIALVVHCRAGISRSAAIALFVAEETGCEFPRQPFAGLANKHVLSVLQKLSGRVLDRPRALPKRERFSVSVERDFETGQATVTVENARSNEQVTIAGPMLEVTELAAAGIKRVWGIMDPLPSYHVTDWDSLD